MSGKTEKYKHTKITTTGLDTVNLLEIKLTRSNKNNILEYIEKYLNVAPKSKSGKMPEFTNILTIFTPNPELIVYAHQHPWFKNILNQADISVPDGIGVVLASRFLAKKKEYRLMSRISGIDLMQELISYARKRGVTIGLIGGRKAVALEALECLKMAYPGLRGWAMGAPEIHIKGSVLAVARDKKSKLTEIRSESYVDREINEKLSDINPFLDQVTSKIKSTSPGFVFIGLGAPKQELLISELKARLSNEKDMGLKKTKPAIVTNLVLMAVGGSFDILSGRLPRAPKLVRIFGMEWLFRLILEPWRWIRQLSLVRFLYLIGQSVRK